ncbi:hypothetical protein N0V88_006928 [Collariella sp. IMI 366227]|nr:hypothetical protein N0V88_006928 [Collariella sp. IMI 366227]
MARLTAEQIGYMMGQITDLKAAIYGLEERVAAARARGVFGDVVESGQGRQAPENPNSHEAETAVDGAAWGSSSAQNKWQQIRQILASDDRMAHDPAHDDNMEELFRCLTEARGSCSLKMPTCANPRCKMSDHTIAVCPVPVCPEHGDMSGCFFCNVVEHNADDCPMMQRVSPTALCVYLITNRDGLPPWQTRVDWVKLALDNCQIEMTNVMSGDIINFKELPLTRAYVKRVYVPQQQWKNVGTTSPYIDPLFANATHKVLKQLSKNPAPGKKPLAEHAQDLCYCRNSGEHPIFKNRAISRYIPDMSATEEDLEELRLAQEEARTAVEKMNAKKLPKQANKDKMGRRKAKRAAAAAAAAAEDGGARPPSAAAENGKATPSATPVENVKNKGKATAGSCPGLEKDANGNAKTGIYEPSSDEDNEVPLSERMLKLTEQVEEMFLNMQKAREIVSSK